METARVAHTPFKNSVPTFDAPRPSDGGGDVEFGLEGDDDEEEEEEVRLMW